MKYARVPSEVRGRIMSRVGTTTVYQIAKSEGLNYSTVVAIIKREKRRLEDKGIVGPDPEQKAAIVAGELSRMESKLLPDSSIMRSTSHEERKGILEDCVQGNKVAFSARRLGLSRYVVSKVLANSTVQDPVERGKEAMKALHKKAAINVERSLNREMEQSTAQDSFRVLEGIGSLGRRAIDTAIQVNINTLSPFEMEQIRVLASRISEDKGEK